jgi:O-succinylbenzoic acid--CoA ligase
MVSRFDALTINHVRYDRGDLLRRGRDLLNEPDMPDWKAALYRFILDWIDDRDHVSLRTSGSTGAPKEFKVPKQKLIASANATARHFGLMPDDTALLCLPVDHIAGRMMVVRAFVSGLDLIVLPPDARPLLKLGGLDIRFAALVPMQLESLLGRDGFGPEAVDALERIDILLLGGAATREEIVAALQGIRTRVFASYGMTETLSHVAIKPLNRGEGAAGYTPLDGVRVRLDDDRCLVIDVDYLAIRSLQTNDIADLAADGTFELIGRKDLAINSGGIKLFPEQIEQRLAHLMSGRCFFVCAAPDARLGAQVGLLIEGEPWPDDRRESVWRRIGEVLNQYEKPRKIEFVPEFVRSETGKIRRSETLKAFGLFQ